MCHSCSGILRAICALTLYALYTVHTLCALGALSVLRALRIQQAICTLRALSATRPMCPPIHMRPTRHKRNAIYAPFVPSAVVGGNGAKAASDALLT